MNKRPAIRGEISAQPVIGLANTNFELVEKCHQILNMFEIGHHISPTYYRKDTKNNKPQKAIQIRGFKRVKQFINIFGDFISKREQVNVFRDFISYREKVNRYTPYGEHEGNLLLKLRKLNQKGILRDYTSDTNVSEDIVRSHAKV